MSGVAKLHPLWFDTEIARQNHPQRSPAHCKSALQFRKAKALGTKNFLFGEGSAKAAKFGIRHVQIYAPQVHLPVLEITPGAGSLPTTS